MKILCTCTAKLYKEEMVVNMKGKEKPKKKKVHSDMVITTITVDSDKVMNYLANFSLFNTCVFEKSEFVEEFKRRMELEKSKFYDESADIHIDYTFKYNTSMEKTDPIRTF